MDDNLRKCLNLIEEWGENNKPKTLKELFEEHLQTANFSQSHHVIANELVDIVKKWLPPSSKTNTYDWERCLKLMKNKLR